MQTIPETGSIVLQVLRSIDENQIGKWYHGVPVVATYDNMFQYVKEQIVE